MRLDGLLRAHLVLLFAIALLVPGCGRKTLPIPPQDLVAVAVTDLAATLDDNGITLTWTAPRKTLQGKQLNRVDGYELLRAQVPASRYCPECPAVFSPLATVAGGAVVANGERVRLRHLDLDLAPGNYYLYKVRSRSGWYAVSQDSNRAAQLWENPAEADPDAGDNTAEPARPNP